MAFDSAFHYWDVEIMTTPKMFLYVLFISLQRNRFYVSFVYSANEFDKGNAHLDVFLPQLPDTPIFSLDQPWSCDDIKRVIPNLVCPIKANGKIN